MPEWFFADNLCVWQASNSKEGWRVYESRKSHFFLSVMIGSQYFWRMSGHFVKCSWFWCWPQSGQALSSGSSLIPVGQPC